MVFQDTSLQIDVFGGVNYLFSGKTDDIAYYRYIHEEWKGILYAMDDRGPEVRFIPYFGFGVKFGFDL